ncbi:MAG: protein translocase subunit SecD [Candidatus Pacebacteria bacterium]|nr:protein translocase subunit SecD [Candidatus Paceibacterota bacterium]
MLLILAAAVGYFVYSSQQPGGSRPFRLGLDLSGGTHLVYKADVSKIAESDISDSMSSLRDVVERRVNMFGVSEPLVQTEQAAALSSKESAYKLIVELPGVTDVDEAVKSIGATPVLDFRLVTADAMREFEIKAASFSSTTGQTLEIEYLSLFKDTGLTGSMVAKANLEFNTTTNQPVVGLVFTTEGRDLFSTITKDNIGNYLGIFLDGVPISVPVIRDQIADGRGQISGTFTLDEAKKLVRDLNYGALPVPITLISTQTIGPSLGQAAVNGGIKAGIISFLVIAIFLIVWYRLPGVVAVIALAVYTIIMLALFKLIPVTLTAAGIAAFILSIGMAVDANILIFERMKEELARGRGVWDAMHEGFARAWLSIRDSNISSIITGAILYYFGSTAVITGFALVFVVGVIVSMFTAITASRLFLYAIAPSRTTKFTTFLISNGFMKFKS